jgi:acyl-coenzyme A synthetase/AMP-(fatty) acid ligase
VSPATVERALLELPGVVDAAVIGVPHPELGEEVGAFVVVSGHENASDLQRRLRGTLASFAVPSRWWLQTEPLPVNQTGKVDKPALVTRVREESVRIGTTTPA